MNKMRAIDQPFNIHLCKCEFDVRIRLWRVS